MFIKDFQDLIIWQKAHVLVKQVYLITKDFPGEEKYGIVSQIRRSSVSVCANITEGYRKSTKEFVRYLIISQASLEETKYYIILSKDLKYCNEDQVNCLFQSLNEVAKLLSTFIYQLRKRI